jgi:hypothetical protein
MRNILGQDVHSHQPRASASVFVKTTVFMKSTSGLLSMSRDRSSLVIHCSLLLPSSAKYDDITWK